MPNKLKSPRPFSPEWLGSVSDEEKSMAIKGFVYWRILCRLKGEPDLDIRFYKTYPAWIKLAKAIYEEGIPPMIYLRYLAEETKHWRPNTFGSPNRVVGFWRWLKRKTSKVVLTKDKLNILKALAKNEDRAREMYDDYLASKLRLAYAGLTEKSSLDDLVGVSDTLSSLHIFELMQTTDIADILPDTIFHNTLLDLSDLDSDPRIRERLISYLQEGGYGEEKFVSVLTQWNISTPVAVGED